MHLPVLCGDALGRRSKIGKRASPPRMGEEDQIHVSHLNPQLTRLWAAGADRLGQRLGGVYAANVGGAIVGSLAAGFVMVPLLGAHTPA